MICQSFDTTRHYREQHNMVIEKTDRALLVKLFYLNGSESSAALREYRRMKGFRRGVKWVKQDDGKIRKKVVISVWHLGEEGDPSLWKL